MAARMLAAVARKSCSVHTILKNQMPSSHALNLTGAMASWHAPAGGTEEVPLVQRMRHPLPAPSFAASTAWGHDRFYAKYIPRIGAGAAYLPADHPLTREAERLRDIHLAAMEALVVEQHGANSAVAAAFRANVRSRPIPIRVFSCASGPVAGFTDGNCIAIRDTAVKPHSKTIPHELAHVVLRHVAERQLTAMHERKAKLLGDSVTHLDPQRTALLDSASCLPTLRRLPPGGPHSGLHSSLAVRSLQNLAAAADPAFSSRAVLRTPHAGFNKLPWQTVLAELEADRLALLSMAQAGYDPCPAIHSRLFTLGPTMANWYELQAALLTAAARDPAAVTTLSADDWTSGCLWPNREKQAQNFSQVLPDAMALLERQQGSGGGPGGPYGTAASQQDDLLTVQLWIVYAFFCTAPAGWIQHSFLFWSALSILSILRNR